jgi:hypothetical protein
LSFGLVTGAGELVMICNVKDANPSLAIIPKIGLQMVNRTLSYKFAMFTNSSMRKEVGGHRVTLTYCFNRKSDKVLQSLLVEYRSEKK